MKIILSLLILLSSCYQKEDLPTSIQSQRNSEALENQMHIQTLYAKYKNDFQAPEMTALKAKDTAKNSQSVLVDVREDMERNISIIEGAISQSQFENQKKEHKGKKIIVYCTIGYRSGIYTQSLVEEGHNAFNLIGGVLSWSYQNFPFTDTDGEPTKKVHVYGSDWNLLAPGYQAIW